MKLHTMGKRQYIHAICTYTDDMFELEKRYPKANELALVVQRDVQLDPIYTLKYWSIENPSPL